MYFFFFKQKTAYEMRISDWSSDVCSSDLLVAIFSIIASVPMLFVVIFASLLFQYGVQFWFSDNARSMLQNANGLARGYYEQNKQEVGDDTVTMARDLRDYLSQAPVSSPQFAEGYIFQVVSRKLRSEEPTSELLSLLPISYAVFCLKQNNNKLLQQ